MLHMHFRTLPPPLIMSSQIAHLSSDGVVCRLVLWQPDFCIGHALCNLQAPDRISGWEGGRKKTGPQRLKLRFEPPGCGPYTRLTPTHPCPVACYALPELALLRFRHAAHAFPNPSSTLNHELTNRSLFFGWSGLPPRLSAA